MTRVEAEGLLFDMDGVLISSIASVRRCWRRWAHLYDLPDADTFEIPHGVRALDLIPVLRPDIDSEEGLRVIEDMEIADMADLQVLPGVRELLHGLPADRWAIVTSATRRLLLRRLEAAGLPIPERIISADSVKRGKPDPEPYRRGAELLGVPPSACVVVEDAPSGIVAGVAAGCRVLAVLGTHAREELGEAQWLVRSLVDVSAVVAADGAHLSLQITQLA